LLISQSSGLTRQLKEENDESHNLRTGDDRLQLGAMNLGLTSWAWRGWRESLCHRACKVTETQIWERDTESHKNATHGLTTLQENPPCVWD